MPTANLQDTLREEFGKRYINDIELPASFATSLAPTRVLRPYQEECFRYFITYMQESFPGKPAVPHLLFHMATGSGKTLIMAGCILYLYEKGYRNFLFFVDSSNIVEKTRDNFLHRMSSKYLFGDIIRIGNKQVEVNEVQNFQGTNPNCINFCLTTIQALHTTLNNPHEGSVTYDDFAITPIVLIADEAHHINKDTREGNIQTGLSFNDGEQNDETHNWEQTVMRIFHSGNNSLPNVLLEYTATADLTDPHIYAKYANKLIFDYPLHRFREDGYSKDIEVVQADMSPIDRALQACILSQYKRKLFTIVRQDIKPVVLFKSKTIALNKDFFAQFVGAIRHLTADKIAELRSYAQDDVKKAFDYFASLSITDNNLILELQEDFSEERLLLVDGKNITPEKQQWLNTLEQTTNRFRAVFAVDMLNEGWDVLNLYDIVRLYETRDAKGGKPGKTTMQEAQLIGRGARYMPFIDSNDPTLPVGKRKYDNNTRNPLRIAERLHYHSANNPRYIQELRTAMIQTGIIAPKDIRVQEKLKEAFKQTDLYKKGVVFCNERHEIQPEERAIEGIQSEIRGRVYGITMPSGQMQTAGLFGQHGPAELLKQVSYECSFRALGENVVRFALDKTGFTFSRLHTLYPQLTSIQEFITGNKYLSHIRILVTGAKLQVDDQTQKEKLYIAVQALRQIEPLMEKEYRLYEGTHEFKPVDIRNVFRDHELKITFSNSDREYGKSMCGLADELALNSAIQLDLSSRDWYAYGDCFGTSEEKYLIKYIESVYRNLQNKYTDIYLVRNEQDLKLYSFNEGETFAPDFVLFMRRKDKNTNEYDNLQIFVEPKGEQLLQHDKWKQDFLQSIHKLADISLSFQSAHYNIWGLPFYTHTHSENFADALKTAIQ